MPFVQKDAKGNVIAVRQEAANSEWEAVDLDDPSLALFVTSLSDEVHDLRRSDLDFVRVVEDLVDLLVSKNYILFTELPDKAQEKMRRRQALRGALNNKLDLLGDEDEGFL